jgi:hypothetical protein
VSERGQLRVVAGSPEHWANFEAVKELCVRHGMNPGTVHWIEYDVVDAPLLRFGVFADQRRPRTSLQAEVVEKALVGQVPEWLVTP